MKKCSVPTVRAQCCLSCSQTHVAHTQRPGKPQPLKIPKAPWVQKEATPPLTAAACWPGHVLAQGPLPRCVTLCVSGSTLIHNKKAHYGPLATQCPSGVTALLCSLPPDRQVRCPGELGFSGGHLLGKVPRWTSLWNDVFCFSLKDKNRERPYFPQTTSRVSGNRASLTQGRNTLVNLLWWNHSLFSFFFSKSPYLGQLLFQMSWESFQEHSCNSSRQGTAFSTQYLTEAGRKSPGYRLSLSLIPVDSTSERFRLPCLPRDTRRRGNGQEL